MLLFSLGVILILIPYLAVFTYCSPREGFLKMGAYSSLFYLTLSLVTQAFHVFTYPVVLSFYIVFALFWLIVCIKEFLARKSFYLEVISIKNVLKNNWIFFVAIAVIFLQLFSVHYAYTGTVETLRGQEVVSHSFYTYPFFSDEWVTVSLVNYSIDHQRLPLVNPLYYNEPFPNILLVFPSLLAEFFLITGLNPVTEYSALAIFFGLVLCASLYVLLKSYKVHSYVSAASILCVPYIANTGNLPALWILLPFTIAIIFLIWQLIAQRQRYYRQAGAYAALSLFVYPPIVVFTIPILFVGLFFGRKEDIKSDKKNSDVLASCLSKRAAPYFVPLFICLGASLLIFYLALSRFDMTVTSILSKYIVRPNLDPNIAFYALWNVLPLGIIVLAILGIYRVIKNAYYDILTVLVICFGYWFLYMLFDGVFIIGVSRIVVITSFFLIVAAGFGLIYLIDGVAEMISIQYVSNECIAKRMAVFVGVSSVALSLLLLPSYGGRNTWQKLVITLTDKEGQYNVITGPVVNRYLTADDLRLFEGVKGESFIAPSLKGLVIGVATGNFPLESKSSTITNQLFSYNKFIGLDCAGKARVSQNHHLHYIYADQFNCPQFNVVGHSQEGLYLYRYDGVI